MEVWQYFGVGRIEALRVTSLIAFHRKSAIFDGNVHTVLLLKHCIMVLTCCVVDCKNCGGQENVSFYNIPAVIEHHGEKHLSFHPNGIRNG